VVIKPAPNGTCVKAYKTDSTLLQRLPAKPRGNTQAVLLPAAVSGEGDDVYVGIVHVEVERRYDNYFYKMQVRGEVLLIAHVNKLAVMCTMSRVEVVFAERCVVCLRTITLKPCMLRRSAGSAAACCGQWGG
jgi:hypothetical protein